MFANIYIHIIGTNKKNRKGIWSMTSNSNINILIEGMGDYRTTY